ncbi:hypothetical protein D3C87_1303720 [compost metagenome]
MPRSVRFQPDPLDSVLIDLNFDASPFTPTAVGLILNESYTGCAIVLKTVDLKANQLLRVQVGRLGIMGAKLIWAKDVEEGLMKIGIQFLA